MPPRKPERKRTLIHTDMFITPTQFPPESSMICHNSTHHNVFTVAAVLVVTLCALIAGMVCAETGPIAALAKLTVEPGHSWTTPFGLERVGRPLEAVVEVAAGVKPNEEYVLACYRDGREIRRQAVLFLDSPKHFGRVTLDNGPSEVALLVKADAQAKLVEVARAQVKPMAFEADAVARPERIINPVDLGTILPPADWLLLADGQKGAIDVAAICRTADMPEVRVTAWFHSAPTVKTTATVAMVKDRRVQVSLPLPPAPATVDHDALQVGIGPTGGAELWHKKIETMVVHHPPRWPAFGAVETKLRYDAPISVRKADGKFTSMDYATAWDPKLQDVVVLLPNGSRFVFWRGSCLIPFWAGRHNTGACYEWAECQPPKDATDAVEPLMDKELRYSRVQSRRVDSRAGSRALELPVVRFQLQDLGRFGRRGLLLLSRRLRHARAHAAVRSEDKLRSR